jgi:hypothetical protein
MSRHEVLVKSLGIKLNEAGIRWVRTGDKDLPEILVIDQKYGYWGIMILLEDELVTEQQVRTYVGPRQKNLRDELGNLTDGIRPKWKFLKCRISENESYFDFNLDFFESADSPVLSNQAYDAIYTRFNPTFAFERKKRISLEDPDRDNRESQRILLKGEQREFVELPPHEVLWIKGPAGSGKTLVLLARARRMSKLFPEYQISFITYNRALKRYIQDELLNCSNITVETFYEFSHRRNHKFHFYYRSEKNRKSVSFNQTEIDYARARDEGINKDVDAIFIDEVQDFFPSWLRYCIESQTEDGGGVTLAGDVSQAIYRDSDLHPVITSFDHKIVELPIAYRSTYEILSVVESITGQPQAKEMAPHGPNPDIIFVDTSKNSNALNNAVILDVISFLKNKGIRERDIAILVTQNHYRYKLREELQARLSKEFRYEVFVASIEKGAAEELSILEDSVKLTTVHNAKGLEFSAVFLLGLDALEDEIEEDDDAPLVKKGERIALVGPTRARDRLFIYLVKDNVYSKRLREIPEGVIFRTYPEDYDLGGTA